MTEITHHFATTLYRARLGGPGERRLIADLVRSSRAIAADDSAGQAWCARNGYRGYTSYGSLTDLAWRDPAFADLAARLAPHAAAFAEAAAFDLGGGALMLDNLWINILEPGGVHTGHIHPQSAVSGTLYLEVPPGASAIRFEDPRLPLMMSAPPRKGAGRSNPAFVPVAPRAGTLLLWESWLRHEVPLNRAAGERISISFNFRHE